MDTLSALRLEFDRAEEARQKGNAGQARVCARRAAGIAIRAYFSRHQKRASVASAYDLLNALKAETRLPADLQIIAEHLTMRVTEEFKLPVEADLIAEARTLCDWLSQN